VESERTCQTRVLADRGDLALDTDRELASLAKALGHPLRVRIVRLLARQRACVCGELVGELPVAQSTVSQHLKVLKQAGLIQGTIDGPRVCYCLAPGVLQRLRDLIDTVPRDSGEPETFSTTQRKCG
jgi:ArsR family transcriptional regulator, arsenate/arsenite/antimonite-responsive transcriptional repressor